MGKWGYIKLLILILLVAFPAETMGFKPYAEKRSLNIGFSIAEYIVSTLVVLVFLMSIFQKYGSSLLQTRPTFEANPFRPFKDPLNTMYFLGLVITAPSFSYLITTYFSDQKIHILAAMLFIYGLAMITGIHLCLVYLKKKTGH